MAKITELKTLSVAASAAAILSLSACGSQGGGESEPEEDGNGAETQETTEDSTDESAEEATDEATEDTTEDPTEDPTENSTEDPTEGESSGESAAEGQTGGDDGGPIEDAKAAIAAAEGEVDGTAYEVDFEEADDDDDDDDDEQEPHWSVGVISGDREWEVRVSADGADVLGTEEDDADSDDVSELDAATVTLEEAIDAAAEDTSGDLDDASLDDDNGTLYWEVSIYPEGEQRSQDIDVDAESGGIINR